MSWSRTHDYWAGVREAVEAIERNPDAGLPWNPRLAEVFGDRAALLAALRYRWHLMVQAQDDVPRSELELRHAALLRVIVSDVAVVPGSGVDARVPAVTWSAHL